MADNRDFSRKDEEVSEGIKKVNGLISIHQVDLYYPIFMTVRFLFIFGWLRVAETLYNPFGEDDDDFELNELFDRHFKVGMTMVDEAEDPPELKKDVYWNVVRLVLILKK